MNNFNSNSLVFVSEGNRTNIVRYLQHYQTPQCQSRGSNLFTSLSRLHYQQPDCIVTQWKFYNFQHDGTFISLHAHKKHIKFPQKTQIID